MLHLRTAIFRVYNQGLHVDLIQDLLTAPNLETLVLEDVFCEESPLYDSENTPVLSPLKHIIEQQHCIRNPRFKGTFPIEYDHAGYTYELRRYILRQVHETMEIIRMPSNRLSLSILSSQTWKAMRELTLYGECPVLDAPFISVIQAMPKLRTLKCLIWSFDPIQICPVEPTAPVQIPPLQYILLRNVMLDDPFFQQLPGDLLSLSIRSNYDPPRALTFTSEEMLHFLGSQTFPHLEHLEMTVVVDSEELSLIRQFHCAFVSFCPNIQDLTICLYLSTSADTGRAVTLLFSALTPLRSLRQLRLDFGFLDIGDVEDYMSTTIEALPWLDTIGFYVDSGLDDGNWVVATVDKTDGSVKLGEIHQEIPDRDYGILDKYEAES
ncbi:hypothetical protein K474DRAFT_1712865 [Panus rudis PR-1116 ss-1]|nr:hypothetical protein K474DRAFT_1712865 [Panus rudis PR-1116 ss-1]